MRKQYLGILVMLVLLASVFLPTASAKHVAHAVYNGVSVDIYEVTR